MFTRERSLRSTHGIGCVLVGVMLAVALPSWAKTPQEIFEAASHSIVVVEVHDGAGKLEATGSGVVVATGEVITNCHVAVEGKMLLVRQGKTQYPAQLHYADRDRDLCQLTVPNFKAAPVALGDMTSLKTGARVVAIGAPEGLELSVSEGLISSLREFGGGSKIIQTTAPISPGSSGGGLFDEAGRLIGITTFYLAEGQNLNFALPVNWVAQLPSRNGRQVASKTTSLDRLGMATVLEQKEDWPALVAYARTWSQAEPQNSDAWYTLGESLSGLAQFSQAIDAFRKALRIDPKFFGAWSNIGVDYDELGQYSEAIDAYHEALRIAPKNVVVWTNLGKVYDDLGQYNQAIEACREALRIDPKDAVTWYSLGTTYNHLSQYAEAVEAFREALRIDPKLVAAWNNLGNAYASLSQNTKALDAYREALRIEPKNAKHWFNIALFYGKLNQFDQAIAADRAAIALDPKLVAAWFHLGLSCTLQGSRDCAIEAYQALRILDPAQADKLFNLVIAPR